MDLHRHTGRLDREPRPALLFQHRQYRPADRAVHLDRPQGFLRNVEDTGEFVVNFSSEPLLRLINATATDFPGRSVNSTSRESTANRVCGYDRPEWRPPRRSRVPFAHHPADGNSTLVFGRVLHAAVHEDHIVDGRPGSARLLPLTKLGGDEWGTLGEVLHLSRIPYEEPRP